MTEACGYQSVHVAACGDLEGTGWTILVQISKENTNTRGIDLLESLWKVVEELIDTRLRSSVRLHNVLHGFCEERGMGTAILELKLAQELTSVSQDPMFLVFLDLRNSYDAVDRGRLLTTLEGYSAGPHMCRLLAVFWEKQDIVTCQNGYHSCT